MDNAQELLNIVDEDLNFIKKVITADESWVYGYDIETKVQSNPNGNVQTSQDRKKHINLHVLISRSDDEVYRQYKFRLPVNPQFLCPSRNYKCSDGSQHFLCSVNRTCPGYTQIEMTGTLKSIFIAGHNGIRNKVAEEWGIANMNLVHWSRELETMATLYLRTCHVNNDHCLVIGQNILKVGQNYCMRSYLSTRWPGRVVRAWYLEVGYILSFKDYLQQSEVRMMANFSQMIWPELEFVGCGAANIQNRFDLIVCYYHPPFVEEDVRKVFKLGAPCSKCMKTRAVCSLDFQGLCGIDVEMSASKGIYKFNLFYLFLIQSFYFVIFY